MIHKPIRTIEKAIDRLVFRVSNGRYEPNKTDLEAINFVIEWSNNCKLSSLKSSDLTKKLFIKLFSDELYRAKGDPHKAQKYMGEILEHPLSFYEEQFCKQFDDHTVFNFLDNNGIDSNLGVGFEQLSTEKQKEFEDILMAPDRSDKIVKSLRNTMAEFLIKFSR